MPQLNPNPWFIILLASWSSLIFLFFTKLLLTTFISPIPHYHSTPQTPNWTWLWT